MYPISGISAARESLPIRPGVERSNPTLERLAGQPRRPGDPDASSQASKEIPKTGRPGEPAQPGRSGLEKLDPKQQAEVKELQARDQEVRAHEAAHQAAAGGLGGGASFEYKTGPDGKSYAVGGEVPIDLSPGRTPEETIRRAGQVRAAALAPADPSPQDMAVAAAAGQMEAAARQQLLQQDPSSRAPTRPSSPKDGEAERSVDERHFQAMISVAAQRANQVQTMGQMQRLASRALSAYHR